MDTAITSAKFEIRHYSVHDLAKQYGVSNKTLLKWMQPFASAIGPRQGRYFTKAQVQVIWEKLGSP